MKRAIIRLLLIWGVACCVRSARGAIITIAIEGVVDYAYDPYGFLGMDIEVGDLITGTYTYDADTLDSSPIEGYAPYWYYDAPGSISLSVEGIEFKTDPANVDYRIAISDGYQSRDIYSVRSRNNLPLASGIAVDEVYWVLEDSRQTAISSDALPTRAPLLDDWLFNRVMINGPDRGLSFSITGHVTSAVPVPEPAGVLLLAAGSVLLRKRK
jgi:hypothetical protein